jgi:hypothetical protein
MSRLGRGRGRGRLLNASRAEQQASGDACYLVTHMLDMNLTIFCLPKIIFRLKLRLVFTYYCGEFQSRMNFLIRCFFFSLGFRAVLTNQIPPVYQKLTAGGT